MNRFVFATLCYVQQNGKTLMMHRVKKKDDVHEGKWNGLGGKLNPGETPEECVLREVKEECGLSLINPTLRGVLTFPDFKPGEDWYAFVFTSDLFSGELTECDEGELAWIDTDKLHTLLLWEGDYHFLEWIGEGKFFSAKFCYKDKRLVDHSVVFYS